jgi:hypothetical protein
VAAAGRPSAGRDLPTDALIVHVLRPGRPAPIPQIPRMSQGAREDASLRDRRTPLSGRPRGLPPVQPYPHSPGCLTIHRRRDQGGIDRRRQLARRGSGRPTRSALLGGAQQGEYVSRSITLSPALEHGASTRNTVNPATKLGRPPPERTPQWPFALLNTVVASIGGFASASALAGARRRPARPGETPAKMGALGSDCPFERRPWQWGNGVTGTRAAAGRAPYWAVIRREAVPNRAFCIAGKVPPTDVVGDYLVR